MTSSSDLRDWAEEQLDRLQIPQRISLEELHALAERLAGAPIIIQLVSREEMRRTADEGVTAATEKVGGVYYIKLLQEQDPTSRMHGRFHEYAHILTDSLDDRAHQFASLMKSLGPTRIRQILTRPIDRDDKPNEREAEAIAYALSRRVAAAKGWASPFGRVFGFGGVAGKRTRRARWRH